MNNDRFIDEYQNVHLRDKILGQGGQGVVFRTKDPDLAIKLVTDESGRPLTDDGLLRKYSQRFKLVRLLPLPERLNISLPAALLQNNAGYVMQLLSEMVPFSHFWLDGKAAEEITDEDIPTWLSGMPGEEARKIVHYYKTGGLKRRLIALYKCASLLTRLHGNGLVYGDISPNNIFISEEREHSSVWLIDADNVRFEIADGGSAVYTPKYGAPELVQGNDGGRPTSDCYSFAVVAFYVLSLIHPFVGKKVDGTDDGDWADDENNDEDIEEKAYAGLLPWVDDQGDDSNSTNNGLPRQLILTKKMALLFQNTFSAGRKKPWLRPAIYHWPEALAQASDIAMQCSNCEMSYYYSFEDLNTGENKCPYCSISVPEHIILESYHWYGEDVPLNKPCWQFVSEIKNTAPISIPSRLFSEFTMKDSDFVEMTIAISSNNILIKKSEHGKIDLSIAVENAKNDTFQRIISQTKLNRNNFDMKFWIYAKSNSPRIILASICGGIK